MKIARTDRNKIDTYIISNGMRAEIERIKNITTDVVWSVENQSLKKDFENVQLLLLKSIEKINKIEDKYVL